MDTPEAGPSKTYMTPGQSPYHESSQFRNWRYSPERLHQIRSELNQKSMEVVARNTLAEKEAQISLGHEFTDPPPPQTYLTVNDELHLLKFYCSQISKICRTGFGLPEVVESTAITYLKRFYLKNSVMEWHPKIIMPTCLFLAAKTTNFPIPIDQFVTKIAKLTTTDVLDTEFLVSQSLSFEFWARGAEKPLRGWSLEFQEQPNPPIEIITRAIPKALNYLHQSRLSDVEFLYTPSQIALACFRLSNSDLVDDFLRWKYSSLSSLDHLESKSLPYGMEFTRLVEIISQIQGMIDAVGDGEVDMKLVKNIDKRLKGCTNPEKIPGTALYIKRKAEQEAIAAEQRALKSLKARKEMSDMDAVFGTALDSNGIGNGMGIKDEAMGMIFGGQGLKDVGQGLGDDD